VLIDRADFSASNIDDQRSRFLKSREGTDLQVDETGEAHLIARRLAALRATHFSASTLLANPLAIWEEPTRVARHGSEIGVREAGALSLSAGASLPLPLLSQAVSQGHEITGFGWIHARWRPYVCTFDRSVGRSVAITTDSEYYTPG
jgi:hypothetical protein